MAGRGRSGEGGRRALHLDAREAMQTDGLDQRLDLRLGTAEHDRPPVRAEPAGEHGEVDHQRGIGEYKPRQIHGDVGRGVQRAGQSLPSEPLRIPILVTDAAEGRRLVIEVDDRANLPNAAVR
jgi:hypothetical protein